MKFRIDFIGIGAPKTATTWISECLMEHPEVCFPKGMKEMHFFNEKHIAYGDKVPNKSHETKGMDWFRSRFNHCSKKSKKGEFSVSYLSDEKACERIKKHFPLAKIIVSLRNPIRRVYSSYLHGKRYGDYDKSFEDTIEEDKYLLDKGLFGKHLPMWLKNFDVKIVFQDDIKKKPKEVIQDIYDFIGVDKKFVPPSLNSQNVNKGGVARFPLINKTITKTNHLVRKYNLNYILKIISILGIDAVLEKIRMANVK